MKFIMNAHMLKKYLPVGVIAVVLIGAAVWWFMPNQVAAADRYTLAPVERGPITQMVSANGTLNPVVLVNVGSQVSGIVKKLHADFNDHVKAGQVLLELDPALLQAQLQQSEANVASAKASLDLARSNEERMQGLYKKEYVTRQELDNAVQAFKAAEAQVALAEAQLARDRTNLNYTVIRSPVSGVVVSRDVDVGQTVAASFQTPTLFKIAQDLSHMQIDSSYAEADVGNIRVGQSAEFRVDAFPNRVFRGEVKQIRLNPTTLQNVVTYDVVISVDNPEKILMPGMTAYVSVTVAQRKDALLVPNAALRFHPSEMVEKENTRSRDTDRKKKKDNAGIEGTVYVLEDGQAKAVHIGIGVTDNRMSEVLSSSLKQGDRVIIGDKFASGGASGGRRHMGPF